MSLVQSFRERESLGAVARLTVTVALHDDFRVVVVMGPAGRAEELYSDPDAVAVVKAHLDRDEAVLWVGRPAALSYALKSNGLLTLMGIAGTAMMLSLAIDTFAFSRKPNPYRTTLSTWTPIFTLGMMLPIMAMALAPLLTWLRARATVYALTDRRALMITRLGGLTVTSVEANQIRFVELATGRGGRGTVSFLTGPARLRWSFAQESGFHEIDEAAQVARLMRERLVRPRQTS